MSLFSSKTKSNTWRRWVYDRLIQIFPTTNPTNGYVLTADGSGGVSFAASVASGAGIWAEIDNTTISGSPTEHKISWDESLYSDIKIILNGIQCAVDGISFQMSLGEANGATMHEATGDYDGVDLAWDGSTLAGYSTTDKMVLLTSTGNVSGEVINGTIEIFGTYGTDIGAAVRSCLVYKNSSGNTRVFESRGFLNDGAAAGAIDTYRLFFNATTDRAWANVGSIQTLGLTR